MNRTFITFSYGESNNLLVERLRRSIEMFSEYKLKVYKAEDFNTGYNFTDPSFWKNPFAYIYKVLSCIKSLEEFDQVVWLDTDCLVTKNIDKIWEIKMESYPLLPKHRFYNFLNWPHAKFDWRETHHLSDAKKKIGCIENNFQNIYLQACCMSFDKKSKDFYKETLSYFMKDFDSNSFPFGDETIINTMIWREKNEKNLGDVFLCSHYFSPYILESVILLKNKEDYPKIFDPQWKNKFPKKLEQRFEDHNKLTLIENNFDQILFFHGNKSHEYADKILSILELSK